VFIDLKKNQSSVELKKNAFNVPVFVLDYQHGKDPFKLLKNHNFSRELNIYFRMKENKFPINYVKI